MSSQTDCPSLGGESGVGPGPRGSTLWRMALLLPHSLQPLLSSPSWFPISLTPCLLFQIVLDVCLFVLVLPYVDFSLGSLSVVSSLNPEPLNSDCSLTPLARDSFLFSFIKPQARVIASTFWTILSCGAGSSLLLSNFPQGFPRYYKCEGSSLSHEIRSRLSPSS